MLNKLDIYETLFLIDNGALDVSNITRKQIVEVADKRRPDFQKLYEVYSDWRSKGYVIKTGFKFGTHFRLYFPGRSRSRQTTSWIHSMHVIHVFPRDAKLLISEWARAIRVAHSVRKTFILAIPGKSRTKKLDIDFVLYHRKNSEIETPEKTTPRYGMLSLSEEEYIGGSELSAIINEAKNEQAGADNSDSRQGDRSDLLQGKEDRAAGQRLRVLRDRLDAAITPKLNLLILIGMNYDKLVRDKIPEKIKEDGGTPIIRTASQKEYKRYLRNKLVEEANEYAKDRSKEELADVLEVIYKLCKLHGINLPKLERIRLKKKAERGTFDKRIILMKII